MGKAMILISWVMLGLVDDNDGVVLVVGLRLE